MAKTIKGLGILKYLDEVYAAEGGSTRYLKIRNELKWPVQARADEFNVNRETIRLWDDYVDQLEVKA
jgi:hypothetical protein